MSVRLFVGNLPYEVTEEELRELFLPVGPLSTVIIPMDRDTGKPRGFAFVEFSEQAQADEASRRFNNQSFKGRNIVINEARARDARPGAGAGARTRAAVPRAGGSMRSPAGNLNFESGSMDDSPPERSERRKRNFGADAKPVRKKKQRRGNRGETGGRKGPIREKGGGQFFGGVDDDDDFEDVSEYKRRW